MILPKVGQIVHFRPNSTDALFDDKPDPFAAIICQVWSEVIVDLMIVGRTGVTSGRAGVTLWQGDVQPPSQSYCLFAS